MAEIVEDIAAEGERALLRPVRRGDAARAFPLLHGREEILRWLVWDGPADEEELADAYAAWRTGDGGPDACDYMLAVCERASGALAGTLSVRFRGRPGEGDLGYWIAREHQRRGLATDAVRLAAWLAFEELGARALCAWVFVGNEASRRVLERCGFALEHTARAKVVKRGERLDEWYLALARADFERGLEGWRPARCAVRRGARPAP